jgi:hypothetical protein
MTYLAFRRLQNNGTNNVCFDLNDYEKYVSRMKRFDKKFNKFQQLILKLRNNSTVLTKEQKQYIEELLFSAETKINSIIKAVTNNDIVLDFRIKDKIKNLLAEAEEYLRRVPQQRKFQKQIDDFKVKIQLLNQEQQDIVNKILLDAEQCIQKFLSTIFVLVSPSGQRSIVEDGSFIVYHLNRVEDAMKTIIKQSEFREQIDKLKSKIQLFNQEQKDVISNCLKDAEWHNNYLLQYTVNCFFSYDSSVQRVTIPLNEAIDLIQKAEQASNIQSQEINNNIEAN